MDWDDVVDEITREANFVVPIQVVEELDRQKDRGQGDARNNARVALKWLDDVVGSGNGSASFRPEDSDSKPRFACGWTITSGSRLPRWIETLSIERCNWRPTAAR
ncbi:PIN domain-containing protein [Microbacterium gallinarum]|uniref:PIN domain-containing protein n=1 Tax=Microbacterium gallinarum TaxID=2762209 RepID=A0ABR8X5J5_9MICO|nr:hypothetical protein [Microbacterium gallinarum]